MTTTETNYYDGLNTKLLAAIPADARRVLELGCANGRLGRAFKSQHPSVQWYGVELFADAAAAAARHLDRVMQMDLDRDDLSAVGRGFDVIVMGDVLEHLRHPEQLLTRLYEIAAPDARIICCLPNMGHISVLQRLVAGDISYDDAGLLDRTHVRFYSPSSAYKLFLDGGWLPDMRDQYRVDMPDNTFSRHIVEAAKALGVPEATAARNLGLYQMVLVCRKWNAKPIAGQAPLAPFSVIVPVSKPWQYELNVARSPGLQEVGAEVIYVPGATSAAAAFARGAAKATRPWRLMVHQDVYFPAGSGFMLAQRFAELERHRLLGMPVGFAGLATQPAVAGSLYMSGMVIDRSALFSHPVSDHAVSLDEFAVALHRDSVLQPDPALGWHLWATDLCLQAETIAGVPVAKIIEIPLFHNSVTAHQLPQEFHHSAERLLAKYPQRSSIPTLCGSITRSALPEAAVS